MADLTQQLHLDDAVKQLHGLLSQKGQGATHAATAVGISTADFCKAWPTVKGVLQILANIPVASWAVNLVITLGDAYSSRHCQGS